jgi:hypothetical protein
MKVTIDTDKKVVVSSRFDLVPPFDPVLFRNDEVPLEVSLISKSITQAGICNLQPISAYDLSVSLRTEAGSVLGSASSFANQTTSITATVESLSSGYIEEDEQIVSFSEEPADGYFKLTLPQYQIPFTVTPNMYWRTDVPCQFYTRNKVRFGQCSNLNADGWSDQQFTVANLYRDCWVDRISIGSSANNYQYLCEMGLSEGGAKWRIDTIKQNKLVRALNLQAADFLHPDGWRKSLIGKKIRVSNLATGITGLSTSVDYYIYSIRLKQFTYNGATPWLNGYQLIYELTTDEFTPSDANIISDEEHLNDWKVGGYRVNPEVLTLSKVQCSSSPASGYFYFAEENTGRLPWNVSNREIEIALENMAVVGVGNVSVNRINSKSFSVRFFNKVSKIPMPKLVVSSNVTATPEKIGFLPVTGAAINSLFASQNEATALLEFEFSSGGSTAFITTMPVKIRNTFNI